jgi:hypothetical protein
VIEVAHDSAEDRLELGEHASEQSAVAHLGQPRPEPRARPQKGEERRAVHGPREEFLRSVPFHALLNPGQRAVRDRGVGFDRGLKQPQPALGMRAGIIGIDEPDAVGRSHEIRGDRYGRDLPDPFERSADGAGVAEVVAHQTFDLLARRAAVGHQAGGPLLRLVIQDVVVPFVHDVEDGPETQQELLGFVETGAVGRAAIDDRGIGDGGDRARGPDVAKGARRVLDVGFELVQRVVEARVPLVDQPLQRVENPRVRRGRADARGHPIEQRRVAGDGARVEQREQEFGVVDFELGEVAHLPDLMADREVRIPQRMQDGADALLLVGSDLAVEQKKDVDVGVEAELTPTVAAERDDQAGRRAGRRVGEKALKELVDAIRKAAKRRPPALAARSRGRQFLSRAFDGGERRRHARYWHAFVKPGTAARATKNTKTRNARNIFKFFSCVS